MSTKDLSHTVIEGGRHRYNAWVRRWSNRVVRKQVRAHCMTLLRDPDAALPPTRRPVPRDFADKLAPAQRFLESRVGRSWSKVYSELRRTFDTRTTAGRHIVFDHMLAWVDGAGHGRSYALFVIDGQGRLQRRENAWRRKRVRKNQPLPEERAVLERWIGMRAVGEVGRQVYWFQRTSSGAFRQARPLGAEEQSRYFRLPAWYRRMLTPEKRNSTIQHGAEPDAAPQGVSCQQS